MLPFGHLEPRRIRYGQRGRRGTSPYDARTVGLMRAVADTRLDAPPPLRRFGDGHAFEYLGNDRVGDCTCVGPLHLIDMLIEATGSGDRRPTQDDAFALYRQSGWNGVAGSSSDQGWLPVDALAALVASKKWAIDGFLRIPLDVDTVQSCINLFGGVIVGADLPARIEHEDEWLLPPIGARTDDDEPGSDGGHCFLYRGFDASRIAAEPWIDTVPVDYPWHELYVTEAWVMLYRPWLELAAKTTGFDHDRLLANYAKLRAA